MSRQRRSNTNPLRVVTSARLRHGRGGFNMRGGSPTITWWELELECGHNDEEHSVRYQKGASGGAQGYARLHQGPPADELALPAPKRVRCSVCGRAARKELEQQVRDLLLNAGWPQLPVPCSEQKLAEAVARLREARLMP